MNNSFMHSLLLLEQVIHYLYIHVFLSSLLKKVCLYLYTLFVFVMQMWKVTYVEMLNKAEEDNDLVKKRKGKLEPLPLAAYVDVVYHVYVSLKESDACHLHCHLLPLQLHCFIFSVQQHLVALEEEWYV